ncbi:hypothetical protein D9M70_529790 [compost metagenome]
MPVLKVARIEMIVGSGFFSDTVILLPSAVTLSTAPRSPAQGPSSGLRARSSEKTTSAPVRSEPSENFRPVRSAIVMVLPSAETSWVSASPGTIEPSGPLRNSVS